MNRLGLLILLAACTAPRKGTETGNPSLNPDVALEVRTSVAPYTARPNAVSLLDEGGDLVIDAAWLTLSDVRFREASDCKDETETEGMLLAEPVTFNLLDGTTAFKLPLFETNYCEVRLDFGTADVVTGPQPGTLLDAAVVVEAHRADGVPVMLQFPDNLKVKLNAKSAPFALDDAQDALLLAIDLSEWVVDLDLDAEEPDDDGEIVVDGIDDDDLGDQLNTRLEASISLHYDRNANGVLDDDEMMMLNEED